MNSPKHRIWSAREVMARAKAKLTHGLEAAAQFYAEVLRNLVGIPGPYVMTISRTGKVYYRRLVKATPGAPLQMMTKYFRNSITVVVDIPAGNAKVGTDAKYVRRHERDQHPSFVPALMKHLAAIGRVAGGKITAKVM